MLADFQFIHSVQCEENGRERERERERDVIEFKHLMYTDHIKCLNSISLHEYI